MYRMRQDLSWTNFFLQRLKKTFSFRIVICISKLFSLQNISTKRFLMISIRNEKAFVIAKDKKNKDGSFKINLAASYTLNFNHVHLSILILLATSSYYHHLRKDFHMLIIMNHQKLLFHTALWAMLRPTQCG